MPKPDPIRRAVLATRREALAILRRQEREIAKWIRDGLAFGAVEKREANLDRVALLYAQGVLRKGWQAADIKAKGRKG